MINAGINVNISDNNNETALHLAVKKNFSEIVDLLLIHEVNLSAIDGHGKTALHLALENGFQHIATNLIKSGIDITVIDENKKTALQLAIEKDYTDIIALLTNLQTTQLNNRDSHSDTHTEEL